MSHGSPRPATPLATPHAASCFASSAVASYPGFASSSAAPTAPTWHQGKAPAPKHGLAAASGRRAALPERATSWTAKRKAAKTPAGATPAKLGGALRSFLTSKGP